MWFETVSLDLLNNLDTKHTGNQRTRTGWLWLRFNDTRIYWQGNTEFTGRGKSGGGEGGGGTDSLNQWHRGPLELTGSECDAADKQNKRTHCNSVSIIYKNQTAKHQRIVSVVAAKQSWDSCGNPSPFQNSSLVYNILVSRLSKNNNIYTP